MFTTSRIFRACQAMLLLLMAGCVANTVKYPHPVPHTFYASEFDAFWDHYARYYPYFDYKHVDWDAQYTRYRPQADLATSQTELVGILKKMLAPLRDVHAVLITPDDRQIHTYEPVLAPNWDYPVIEKYVPDRYTFRRGNWFYGRIGGIGYIMIPAWTEHDFSLRDFDKALVALGRSPALIIDVRMNGGGDDGLAYDVASRLAGVARVTEYLRYRDGPSPGDLTPLEPRRLHPRWFWQYTRPVAVLIGPDCFSSNESFIAAMQTQPNVVTMGATTGGGSGNPRFFYLGDGWRYSVPTWIDYTADKKIIEWNGIQPQIPVKTTPEDFRRGDDPVLDAALRLLRQQLARVTPVSSAPHR